MNSVVVVCVWAIMVEVVPSPHSPYRFEVSDKFICLTGLGCFDSIRVQAILMNLGGIKGSAAALWMKFLVSTSFLYISERLSKPVNEVNFQTGSTSEPLNRC